MIGKSFFTGHYTIGKFHNTGTELDRLLQVSLKEMVAVWRYCKRWQGPATPH